MSPSISVSVVLLVLLVVLLLLLFLLSILLRLCFSLTLANVSVHFPNDVWLVITAASILPRPDTNVRL